MKGKKILVKKGDRVFITENGAPIENIVGGVIITCRDCGKKEVVNKGSVCDQWKLCREHAQQRLKTLGF